MLFRSLLQGGYAAMDNLLIAASDTAGDVGGGGQGVPEPLSIALLGIGLAALRVTRRRH